jgi:hypothetical protein
MSKYFDVTLVGIYGGKNHDGQPHEISGRLYVKTLNRDHTEHTSHDMFVSDTPVTINVGSMFSIDKEIRETIAEDSLEINLLGEYLAIGGTLLGGTLHGKPRYTLIHTFLIYSSAQPLPTDPYPPEPAVTYWVYFTSEDIISQWVAAKFDVRFGAAHF